MQHRILSADEIYTLNGPSLKKGFVLIDGEGKILDVLEHHQFDGEPSQVEWSHQSGNGKCTLPS
jgi:hypothetical protein